MRRTVFISSTFKDLKKHRRKAWDTLQEYDVNIRGMERFGARSEKPLQTSLAEVEQSDIYVGIIAYRLGAIDNKTGKSITQLEYEKTRELYELNKKDREILVYCIDPDAPIPGSYIDFGEKHEKLEAFKSVLKENHTIATFTDENDFAEKLRVDFSRLLTKKEAQKQKKTDEYRNSEDRIRRFMLLPATCSGKEIKLRLKFDGEPFPASKSVCNVFNLTYGATIGYSIKFVMPKIKDKFTEYAFVTEELVDNLLKIEDKNDVEVYAKLAFSEIRVEEYRANFLEKTLYDSHLLDISNLDLDFGKRTIPPEGSMILLVTKIVKN